MNRWFGILLCTVSILAGVSYAQVANDYHLFGTVQDSKGRPIEGARIILQPKGGGRAIVIKTDRHGKFDRWFIPHGIYEVRVEKEGYTTLRMEWDLSAYRDVPIPLERHFVLVSVEEVRRQKRLEAAKRIYEEALHAFRAGDCPTAVEKAQQVMETVPDHAGSYLIIGRCALQQGRLDEALTYYQQAMERKPHFPGIYFDIATIYARKGDWDRALEMYQKALEQKPNDVQTMYNIATIYYNRKQWDRCLEVVDQLIDVRRDYADAYRVGGYAAAQKGDFARAAQYMKRYLELRPDAEDRSAAEAIIRLGKGESPPSPEASSSSQARRP